MKQHALIVVMILAVVDTVSSAELVQWTELPSLPDALGVAGAFSGVSSGALIVAGGERTGVES